MSRPRILIVDDHRMFAEGVAQLLRARFDIAGTLDDGSLLIDAVERLHPDVILLDMSMPTVSGLDALNALKARRLEGRAIVLTMHGDARLATLALKAGAVGFVLKESSGDELVRAIDAVLQGRTYLTSSLTKDVLAMMAEPGNTGLTTRQREVLRLISQGLRAKEIAMLLNLSHRTVESVKYHLMQELRVHSTAELVRYAIQHGLDVI